jgi:hypothetical protein
MRAWILMLVLAVTVAACGGDKSSRSDDEARDEPRSSDNAASGELVSAQSVLGQAARNAKAVDSFRGTMEMDVEINGLGATMDGDIVFRAPDATYMQMSMFGSDFEMLVYGPTFYMRPQGMDWMTLDLSATGVDLSQLDSFAQNQGFFDLEEMAAALGDVERLEDDEIDGGTYAHYRAEPNFSDLIDQLPEGFADQSLLNGAEDMIQSIAVEFWLDPQTELPRRFEMSMSMDMPDGDEGEMRMSIDYTEYNVPVDIPAEPVGAPPFDPATLGG